MKPLPEVTPYYDGGYPYVDIYQASLWQGYYSVKWGPPCRFREEIVTPVGKIDLLGKKVSAPRNTTAYLSQIYGPDFMTPPPPERRSSHGVYRQACKDG